MPTEKELLVKLGAEAGYNALNDAVKALVAMEERAMGKISVADTDKDQKVAVGAALGIHAAVIKVEELAKAYRKFM